MVTSDEKDIPQCAYDIHVTGTICTSGMYVCAIPEI